MIKFTEELKQVCISNGVTSSGMALLDKALSNDPARSPRTSSLAHNIPIKFASSKNGVMLSSESMLEYANYLKHEFSQKTKAFIDQPKIDIFLRYRSGSRIVTPNPTFDTLVIGEDFIGIEEVKPNKSLQNLSQKAPDRYFWNSKTNSWSSPTIEKCLEGTGLSFRYVTEVSFTQNMLDNYNFLLPFISSTLPESYANDKKHILSRLKIERCISIEELATEITSVESIYTLIAQKIVYFPIFDRSLLQEKLGIRSIYLAEQDYLSTIIPDDKAIDKKMFLHLSFDAQVDFIKKREVISKVEDGISINQICEDFSISKSTIYRWKKIKDSSGYKALISKKHSQGNRAQRYPQEMIEMAKEKLRIKLSKKEAVVIADAIAETHDLIVDQFGYSISQRTLYTYSNEILPQITLQRNGAKIASKSGHFSKTKAKQDIGIFDASFYLSRCHIDHTQTDIEITNNNGIPLGRPYLTSIVDEYTNKILANYLSFKKPSYITAMMAIRLMVYNHGVMPSAFVTDGGKEFFCHSILYLVSRYHSSLIDRTGKPREASIERLFGQYNTILFHNLEGNTKIMKNVRAVSSTHNPKKLTYYTLDEAYKLIETTANSINSNDAIISGMTPNELANKSIKEYGLPNIRRVLYNKEFTINSLPLIKGRKTIQLKGNEYARYDHKKYWHNILKGLPRKGINVRCKFDPFNPNVIYPEYKNEWVEFDVSKRFRVPEGVNESKIECEILSKELSLNTSKKVDSKIRIRRDIRRVKNEIIGSKLSNKEASNSDTKTLAKKKSDRQQVGFEINEELILNSEVIENGS